MANWIQWEIDDPDGENPLGKPGLFEFNVEFEYDPGEPTVMYFPGGDGSPGYPPQAVITGSQCTSFSFVDEDDSRTPTKDENELLEAWFMSVINVDKKLRAQIETCGLDSMYLEPDYDDVDD